MRQRKHPARPVRGIPHALLHALTNPTSSSRGLAWFTAIAQVLAAAGTIVLAIASFSQLRQASRSAKAMEHANRINVAIARTAAGPRFALSFEGIDSITPSGESTSCKLRVRVRNDDTRSLRVISLYCRVDTSCASIAGLLPSIDEAGALIAVGDTAVFPCYVRVGVPRDTHALWISWLHVCAALRRDGPVGTVYLERVYPLGTKAPFISQMTALEFEYTGVVSGISVQLDPWCDQRPYWPWSNKASY